MGEPRPGGDAAETLTINLPDELVESIAQRAAVLVLERLHQESGQASPFMTIPEAAAYARCKRQRIDDLLSARRLTRHKDGSRTLIRRAELDAHLTAKTGPSRGLGGDSISAAERATVGRPDNRSRV